MNRGNIIILVFSLLVCTSCRKREELTLSGLDIRDFQTEMNGSLTDLYVLRNKQDMEVCVTNYGAHVVSIMIPDSNGKRKDILCGYPGIAGYIAEGEQGFASRIWQAEQLDENALKLSLLSPVEGNSSAGNLKVILIFLLTNNNELNIHCEAQADKTVMFNASEVCITAPELKKYITGELSEQTENEQEIALIPGTKYSWQYIYCFGTPER